MSDPQHPTPDEIIRSPRHHYETSTARIAALLHEIADRVAVIDSDLPAEVWPTISINAYQADDIGAIDAVDALAAAFGLPAKVISLNQGRLAYGTGTVSGSVDAYAVVHVPGHRLDCISQSGTRWRAVCTCSAEMGWHESKPAAELELAAHLYRVLRAQPAAELAEAVLAS